MTFGWGKSGKSKIASERRFMGRLAAIIILLLLIVGGLFFFNGQADPVPLDTIETPVESDASEEGDA